MLLLADLKHELAEIAREFKLMRERLHLFDYYIYQKEYGKDDEYDKQALQLLSYIETSYIPKHLL